MHSTSTGWIDLSMTRLPSVYEATYRITDEKQLPELQTKRFLVFFLAINRIPVDDNERYANVPKRISLVRWFFFCYTLVSCLSRLARVTKTSAVSLVSLQGFLSVLLLFDSSIIVVFLLKACLCTRLYRFLSLICRRRRFSSTGTEFQVESWWDITSRMSIWQS